MCLLSSVAFLCASHVCFSANPFEYRNTDAPHKVQFVEKKEGMTPNVGHRASLIVDLYRQAVAEEDFNRMWNTIDMLSKKDPEALAFLGKQDDLQEIALEEKKIRGILKKPDSNAVEEKTSDYQYVCTLHPDAAYGHVGQNNPYYWGSVRKQIKQGLSVKAPVTDKPKEEGAVLSLDARGWTKLKENNPYKGWVPPKSFICLEVTDLPQHPDTGNPVIHNKWTKETSESRAERVHAWERAYQDVPSPAEDTESDSGIDTASESSRASSPDRTLYLEESPFIDETVALQKTLPTIYETIPQEVRAQARKKHNLMDWGKVSDAHQSLAEKVGLKPKL